MSEAGTTESGPRRATNRVEVFPERIPLNGDSNMVVEPTEVRCEIATLAKRRLIIISAMVNAQGDEAGGEWISMQNVGSSEIGVAGWTLVDSHQRKAVLDGHVGPGASLLLNGTGSGTIKLSNSGGGLMLYDDHGCVIDHVTWSTHDVERAGEGVAVIFSQA